MVQRYLSRLIPYCHLATPLRHAMAVTRRAGLRKRPECFSRGAYATPLATLHNPARQDWEYDAIPRALVARCCHRWAARAGRVAALLFSWLPRKRPARRRCPGGSHRRGRPATTWAWAAGGAV